MNFRPAIRRGVAGIARTILRASGNATLTNSRSISIIGDPPSKASSFSISFKSLNEKDRKEHELWAEEHGKPDEIDEADNPANPRTGSDITRTSSVQVLAISVDKLGRTLKIVGWMIVACLVILIFK